MFPPNIFMGARLSPPASPPPPRIDASGLQVTALTFVEVTLSVKKETYHFFRGSLTQIHCIKFNPLCGVQTGKLL